MAQLERFETISFQQTSVGFIEKNTHIKAISTSTKGTNITSSMFVDQVNVFHKIWIEKTPCHQGHLPVDQQGWNGNTLMNPSAAKDLMEGWGFNILIPRDPPEPLEKVTTPWHCMFCTH